MWTFDRASGQSNRIICVIWRGIRLTASEGGLTVARSFGPSALVLTGEESPGFTTLEDYTRGRPQTPSNGTAKPGK